MKSAEYVQQQTERLLSNLDFQADVRALRETLGLPANGLKNDRVVNKWQIKHWHYIWYKDEKDNPARPTIEAVTKMLYKYGLAPGWHHSIMRYLFLNNPNDMQLPTLVRVHTIKDELTGLPEVHIIVSEHAAKSDIEWKRVKQYLERLPYNTQSRRPAYLQKIAKTAYEMNQQSPKLAWPDIHQKIKDTFGYKQDLRALQDLVKKYRRRVGVSKKPK